MSGNNPAGKKDEIDTWDKNKLEVVVQNSLVFFEKNLIKMANLDQSTCKKKAMKGKLGKDSITSSLYKISKCKLQESQATHALQQ